MRKNGATLRRKPRFSVHKLLLYKSVFFKQYRILTPDNLYGLALGLLVVLIFLKWSQQAVPGDIDGFYAFQVFL